MAARTQVPDRVVASVTPPPRFPLSHDDLFDNKNLPRCHVLAEHLAKEGRLSAADALEIVTRATDLFSEESNLLEISAPLTICGDVHGQYYDLLKLFEVGGDPATTTYLFLGDYVDRGHFSIEVVLLMYAYKICYPSTFLMIRGNHECRHLTDYFTFREECAKKYHEELYHKIMTSFDSLPLAAVMNGQFLCVHGGVSPSVKSLDDIREINRFTETPQSGAMCDLLWADPVESYETDIEATFSFNEARGCSYAYGFKAVCEFLEENDLLCIIRAHEAQDAGYKMHRRNDKTGFPSVITLFSAPNYLDAYGNKAAVMRYENNVMNIRQFHHSEHPYWLPNFMDVFTWSMPFVADKVSEIMLTILKLCVDEEEGTASDADKERRKEALRQKIRVMAKMSKMYNTLCDEREAIIKLKGLSDTGRLPPGLLSQGKEAIEQCIGDFSKAKQADRLNERMPPTLGGQRMRGRGASPAGAAAGPGRGAAAAGGAPAGRAAAAPPRPARSDAPRGRGAATAGRGRAAPSIQVVTK